MQPKFTLRSLSFFCRNAIAIILLITTCQFVLAQQSEGLKQQHLAYYDNDAGLPNQPLVTNRQTHTEAICTTYTSTIDGTDPTTPVRSFRDGVASTCAVPGPCTAPIAGTFNYKIFTWTNPLPTTQCVTVVFTNTSTGITNFIAAHDGPVNFANLCANYLGDPGSSPAAGASGTFSFNAPGLSTIHFFVTNLASGQATSFTFTVDASNCTPPSPCSGTPTPGNTIASTNPVCPAVNFTLSLQNPTTGSGVTYQWQSSPNGTTWTNISGATGPTYTTSITATTHYRCIVTCTVSGGSATSNPVQVNMNPPSACYCIPPPSDCTDNDVITRVIISTLNNPSGCSSGPPAGYANYTTTIPAPNVFSGAPNPITVEAPPNWTESVAVWIDYNQNGQFEASEFTLIGTKAAGQTSVTNNINIPATALNGITRMRVRIRFATALGPGDACIGYTFGETEDYNVNITPCVPGVFTAHPPNRSIQCSQGTTFTVAATGSLLNWAWQYRTSSSSPNWFPVTDGGIYSGATTNTLTLSNVPQTMSGYQYRAIMTGACTAMDFSNPGTLTVTPLIPTVNPASATICTGTIQQLTLTNVIAPSNLVEEGFNTVSPLPTGWASQNLSSPLGTTGWFQGNSAVFPAQSGPATSYIAANWQNTTASGVGTISNWLFMPNLTLRNGDILRFWTRTVAGAAFPDRLQVRMSTNGASTNAGTSATSVGDFTTLLLDINPTYTTTGYPTAWTQFSITISGLPGPTSGRIAFRYFVENGGGLGANSDYIGIDNVTYTTGGVAQGVWTASPATPNTMFTDPAATIPYTGTLANSIYVAPTVNTVYSVQFNTTTPCVSAVTNIPVNVVNPVSNVVNPQNRSVCVGGSTTFSVSASGGPLTYQWQVSTNGGVSYSNVTSGGTSATLTLTDVTQAMHNNLYRCVIAAPPCAGSVTTAAATLTVNPLPNVLLSAAPAALMPGQTTTITASSTPAGSTYSWTFNGAPIPGATGSSVVANVDGIGTYTATVTDVNGCVNTSSPFTITALHSPRLFIYPNPAPDGKFQVRLYSGVNFDYRKINIYSASGHKVWHKDINTSAPWQKIEVDLGHLSAGVYLVEVIDRYDTKNVVGKVIIR